MRSQANKDTDRPNAPNRRQDAGRTQNNYINNSQRQQQDQRSDYQQYYDNENMNDYDDENQEISSADILPTDKEKTSILSYFSEMRRESAFCDISFTCQGVLLRAHKVIVSSWSRWLRSLLLEGTDDETLSLDIFDPVALSSILDYMYGIPLHIDVELADDLLKVIRRLELQELEQQCWRFLISAMNDDNCNILHDLADRYDCPPLKLAAFRMLQETDPMYAYEPINFDVNHAKDHHHHHMKVGSGLTGPGERSYYIMSGGHEDYDEDDDVAALSVLDFARNMNDGETDDDRHNNDDDDDQNDDRFNKSSSKKKKMMSSSSSYPDQLPANASAAEVVRAWGNKLQNVYEQCLPADHHHITSSYDDDHENDENNDDYDDRYKSNPPPSSTIRFNYTRAPSSRKLQSSMLTDARRKGPQGLDWKNELKRFYLAIKMPEKLSSLDEILSTWIGKEDQMLAAMMVKYKKLMPRALLQHVDNLQMMMETQTESSFVHVNGAAASYRNNNNNNNTGAVASGRSNQLASSRAAGAGV